MADQNPKVSVVIPSYNHAKYLPLAIDSVLAQTFTDFDVVVVDDGSSDDSVAIAQRYAATHPRVRCVTHENRINRGIGHTMNLGIATTSGQYAAWLGSDDLWKPDYLKTLVPLFDRDPKVGIAYCQTGIVDSEGAIAPAVMGIDISRESSPCQASLHDCVFPALAVMVRRAAMDEVGRFDPQLLYNDWELWIRCMARWKVAYSPQSQTLYRIHGGNIYAGKPQSFQHKLAVMLALKEKAPHIGGELALPRTAAMLDLEIAYLMHRTGGTNAREYVFSAFNTDPTLASDVAFFTTWFRRRPPDAETLAEAQLADSFDPWFLQNIPEQYRTTLAQNLRHPIKAAHAIRILKRSSNLGNQRRAAAHLILRHPTALANPRLWSLTLQGLLGPRLTTLAVRIKRLVRAPAIKTLGPTSA